MKRVPQGDGICHPEALAYYKFAGQGVIIVRM